jgi:hypothetical protein
MAETPDVIIQLFPFCLIFVNLLVQKSQNKRQTGDNCTIKNFDRLN